MSDLLSKKLSAGVLNDPMLQHVLNIAARYRSVRSCRLFGSRAKGNESPVSDYAYDEALAKSLCQLIITQFTEVFEKTRDRLRSFVTK